MTSCHAGAITYQGCQDCVWYAGCRKCYPTYYLSATFCYDCPKYCENCNNGTSCNKCVDIAYLKNGQCYPNPQNCLITDPNTGRCTQCNSNFFIIESSGLCDPCSKLAPNAKCQCNGNAIPNCLSCDGGSCKTCQNGYKSIPEVAACEKNLCASNADCEQGLYCEDLPEKINSCQKCPEGCTSCTSPEACIGCTSDYIFNMKKCQKKACTANFPCPEGQFCQMIQFVPNKCVGCKEGCKDCDSKGCKSCKDGFLMKQGVCAKDECDASKSCPDAMFCVISASSGNVCQACGKGCQACRFAESCDLCPVGTFEQAGACLDCAEIQLGGQCQCNGNFVENCTKCEGFSPCESCITGYFPSEGKCVPQACSDTIPCPQAQFCKITSGSPNACAACAEGCTDCDSTTCKTCSTGYQMVGGACAAYECDASTPCASGSFCSVQEGAANKCETCIEGCSNCSSSSGCEECESGLKMVKGACVKPECDEELACAGGQFCDSEYKCQNCGDGCSVCKNGEECVSCGTGMSLENGVCFDCGKNPEKCQKQGSSSNMIAIIAGVIGGLLLLIIIAVVVILVIKKRKQVVPEDRDTAILRNNTSSSQISNGSQFYI